MRELLFKLSAPASWVGTLLLLSACDPPNLGSFFNSPGASPTHTVLITSIAPPSGALTGGNQVTVSGSGFEANAQVTIGNTDCGNALISSAKIICTAPEHSEGLADVQVTNSDGSSAVLAGSYSFIASPTVTAVSPASGPTGGGTAVQITGSEFTDGTTVSIGTAPCNSVVVSSPTELTCTTSSHASGPANIVVTVPGSSSVTLISGYLYNAAPTFGSVTPSSGPVSGGGILTIQGMGFLPGATVSIGSRSCTSALISATLINCLIPGGVAGTNNIVVTNADGQSATDVAGYTYVPPPNLSSVSPSTGPMLGGSTVTLNGSGFQANATILFGGAACTPFAISSTAIACTTSSHAAGIVSVSVTNPDNQFTSAANAYTYVSGPNVVSVSPSSGGISGGTVLTVSGSNFQSGATVSLGGSACPVSATSSTQLTCTTTAHAAALLAVNVTNADGQTGSVANAFTYVGSAVLTSVSPSGGALNGGTTLTINGNGFLPGETISLSGAACGTVNVSSSTQMTCVTSLHSAGTVALSVTDPYGQVSSLPSAYVYEAAPSVSAISPSTGSVVGGTSVTITGSGFINPSVTIGGVPCVSVVSSTTQISCNTSAHASGQVNVVVTNSDNQPGSLTNGFTYQGGPSITSITPTGGALGGGTPVTIRGTGFTVGASVSLGTSPCSVTSGTTTQIVCTTSSHGAASVNVVVTNTDSQTGTLSSGFTYQPAPTLTSVSPSAGSLSGNTIITISGTGFLPSANVLIGTTSCGSVLTSSTSINCVVPASTSSGTVGITVTNTDGQTDTVAGLYTYNAAPFISGLTPTAGPLAGGTALRISGSGFQTNATVTVGGANCVSPAIASTLITCSTPNHSVGSVSVVVTNPDSQSVTQTNGFIYQPAPTVTSISPTSGGLNGGTLVTIKGTGFLSGAAVSLGTTSCSSVTVSSSTQITCTPGSASGGTVSVSVTNSDAQVGSLSNAYTYLGGYTVSGITPNAGALAGGTSVTVTGNGFTTGATVAIGGTTCNSVSVTNSTTLTCTTTNHIAGTVNLVVTDIYSQSTTLSSAYTYEAAPTVTNVSPVAGALSGGTLTITGTNFLPNATVSVGGNVCASPLISSTTISCTAPSHAAGLVSLTVTNADNQAGTENNAFTYEAAPTVTSISPTGGSSNGNTSVTVTGTGFLSNASVAIGSIPCTVSAVASTQITCTTQSSSAGSYSVKVTNTDTQSGSLSNGYTYRAAPVVSSVSPVTGFLDGGYTMTLNGTGFVSPISSIQVGTQACTNVTYVSSTQATCTVPAVSTARTVSVALTNNDGQTSTLNNAFSYTTNGFTQLGILLGSIDAHGTLDGNGSSSRFMFNNYQVGVTSDGSNLYVADSQNWAIRKVTMGTWTTSNIAGSYSGYGTGDGYASGGARFYCPSMITIDPTKTYLYVQDYNSVRTVTISTGYIKTLAGSPNNGGYTDATGTAARFNMNAASGITTDGTNIYVTDNGNNNVRQIVISTGMVTTIAGSTSATAGSANGTGTAATFSSPHGIVIDNSSPANLYVADYSNCTIRKISLSNYAVTTAFGTAGTCANNDGVGGYLNKPASLAYDGYNLYVGESYGGNGVGATALNEIRQINLSTGYITTLAGSPSVGNLDGTGSLAEMGYPSGLWTNGSYVYFLDAYNSTVRELQISSGAVTTINGIPNNYGFADGSQTQAQFWAVNGVTVLNSTLYLTDTNNSAIRATSLSTLQTETLAGGEGESEQDGVGQGARFNYPWGITNDGTYLYVSDYNADTIRRVNPNNSQVITLAGLSGTTGTADGAGTVARFNEPLGLTSDGTNLYICDYNNHTIRKLVLATNVVSTIAGTHGTSGSANGTGTAALFNYPRVITNDGTNLYVGEWSNCDIRVINMTSLAVTTLAGAAGNCSFANGTGTNAHFNGINGITFDGTNLYVTEATGKNYDVRQITLGGVVTTVTGSPSYNYDSLNGGTLPNAYLRNPAGLVWTQYGMFVTNSYGLDILH